MKPRALLALGLLLVVAGGAAYLAYQEGLVPVPLAEARDLYVPAAPEFGEDAAQLEAVMPAGPGLEQFLANQSDLTVLQKGAEGAWVGQLASGLQGSRHARRWRISVRTGWRLQDGAILDATRLGGALGPDVARLDGEVRVVDAMTLDLRFKAPQPGLPDQLVRWRVPGTGPFIRQGHDLRRFDGFIYGRAGVAGLSVKTDSAVLESRAWADGLATGRWAWAVFPGTVAPEDMARVRMAPCDELRMKDGSVWFLNRRLRRLRPVAEDWTRTRLFGIWKGAMDLPYDPLGM